jgi:DNA-binding transcriptional LysR family regulator
MDADDLRGFVVLAEELSELRVQLAIRTTRKVILTPAGVILADEAPAVIDMMETLVQRVRSA